MMRDVLIVSLLAHRGFDGCLLTLTPRSALVNLWVGEHTLRAEELPRNVEGFTSDNYNLLAVEQLLGDGTGQATEKMSLAIDDDLEMRKDISMRAPRSSDIQLVCELGDIRLAQRSTSCSNPVLCGGLVAGSDSLSSLR